MQLPSSYELNIESSQPEGGCFTQCFALLKTSKYFPSEKI